MNGLLKKKQANKQMENLVQMENEIGEWAKQIECFSTQRL